MDRGARRAARSSSCSARSTATTAWSRAGRRRPAAVARRDARSHRRRARPVVEQADEPRAPLRARALATTCARCTSSRRTARSASSPPIGRSSSAGPRARRAFRVPQLVLRKSTYRQFFAPLVDYVEELARPAHPDRDIVVIVPDLVVRHWYHGFLHNNRGSRAAGAPPAARRPARRRRQHALLRRGLSCHCPSSPRPLQPSPTSRRRSRSTCASPRSASSTSPG